ncbi:MAG TPA: PspC domain-containing protein [Solirubrobacteraceae bacterium]|nr:PspC domain-containing protein [Solirubrobacteraceae bacterium]
MESNDQDPTTEQPGAGAGTPSSSPEPPADPAGAGRSGTTGGAADGPRRLYRSRDERMIGGVCGGLAEYFGIDPVIVRIIAVALVFAGGAGILAYLAAWLLVPEAADGTGEPGAAGRTATIAGAVLLVLAIGTLLPFWSGPFDAWAWGGPFVFLVFLGLAGLGVWWLASGEHPSAAGTRDILRRAGLGLALLAVCGLLALAGAWATAAGGGVIVAIVVIVAGLWLVAGAFIGGARWLILPALALALPAGVVSAANVDIDGGVGDRRYHPVAAAEVQDTYRLGVGHLVVDLRDAKLPPGDHRIRVEVGVGAASLAVPRDVCVTSAAHVGAGQVQLFDRGSGGLDVDWRDDRRALPGTTRLIVDGDIGVGLLDISHDDPKRFDRRGEHFAEDRGPGNDACIGGARG